MENAEYGKDCLVMLLANGNMRMNITPEQAKAETRDWLYLGDLAGIAERFQEGDA